MKNAVANQQKKRKVKDEPIIIDSELFLKLREIIDRTNWPYKVNKQQLQLRDKALIAFLILTGVRNSETQTIKRKQTRIYHTHILIVNIQPLKRGNLRKEVILPKTGALAVFTETFQKWLEQVPNDEAVLFPAAKPNGDLDWEQPLSRQRIHFLIKKTNGMFPHWFRGVCESLYGKVVFKNDAWALKDFMGLVNLDSTSPYVSGQWKIHERNIYSIKL